MMREKYATDLTDAQWGRVWANVFGPAGTPETLREIINGLLFVDRSCAAWCLSPHGYPAENVLQHHREQWERDGTWCRVRTVLAETPKLVTAGTKTGTGTGFRQRVSRIIRSLPGGKFLWHVAAAPIHLYQFLGSRFTSRKRVRRFSRHLLQGDALLAKQEQAAAFQEYEKALEVAPAHPAPSIGRATCLFHLERYSELLHDCWQTLASPIALPHHRHHAHMMLAYSLALTGGDVCRAAQHVAEAMWTHEWPAPGFKESIGTVARLESVMKAHDHLAECLINNHKAFPAALELWRRKPEVRGEHPTPFDSWIAPRTLLLPEDWVRNIGHIAYLDTYAKMRMLGWTDWDKAFVFAPPSNTANQHYLSYWSGLYHLITDRGVLETLRTPTRILGPRVAHLTTYPDGSERYFLEGLGVVQEEWEKDGRPPLLSLTPEDREYGRNVLFETGVPKDAWFVCLHVREPGYHKEFGNTHQSHRNADIRKYLPAIQEITRRGGWVIRMGDKSMTPFPPTPGVVDYAMSELKSERMDVFLCGAGRFFLGVASGLCQLPTTFGVPCVLTNWCSNALPLYSRHDLFIPKLIRTIAGKRVLKFEEMYSDSVRHAAYSGLFLHKQGLEATENSPDDLRDVVAEMLDQLDGTAVYSAAENDLQERFAAILHGCGQAGFARVSRRFLANHSDLLTVSAPAGRQAA